MRDWLLLLPPEIIYVTIKLVEFVEDLQMSGTADASNINDSLTVHLDTPLLTSYKKKSCQKKEDQNKSSQLKELAVG